MVGGTLAPQSLFPATIASGAPPRPNLGYITPAFSRIPKQRGDKIRIGCLIPAFWGAHKWAKMLHNPCILGDPKKKTTSKHKEKQKKNKKISLISTPSQDVFLNAHPIQTLDKVTLVNTVVLPRLLYRSESFPLTPPK